MDVDLTPLRELIKRVFVEKNRCKYSLTGKMYVNPFCKFLFILNVIFLPFMLFMKYTSMVDLVNEAKMAYNDVDGDDYTRFTPYENFGLTILFMYATLMQLLLVYILYVVMKECNCARITLVFWESPFWKLIGLNVLIYITSILLFVLIFNKYSSYLLPNIINRTSVSAFV